MNKQYKKEILRVYLSENLIPEMGDIVKGWLAERTDDPVLDAVCWDYFDISVAYREPTINTYRQLRKLEHRLGFEKPNIVRIPLTKRIGFRVAAVLVFMLIVTGILFYPKSGTYTPDSPELAVETPVAEPVTEAPEVEAAPDTVTEPTASGYEKAKKGRVVYDVSVSAPAGSYRSITLPDHSVVLLNGNGQVAYSNNDREVSVSGEAYFNIKKERNKSFRVKTENFVVEVTGTEFYVTAYPGSDRSSVDLLNGSVSVQTKTGSVKLMPSQKMILFHATGVIKLVPSQDAKWWMEPIRFEDKTLSHILEEIAVYYGMKIVDEQLLASNVGYTIKFDKRSSLEHVLKVMEKCDPEYGYRREGSSIIVIKK